MLINCLFSGSKPPIPNDINNEFIAFKKTNDKFTLTFLVAKNETKIKVFRHMLIDTHYDITT